MHTIECALLTLEPQVAAHADALFVVLSDPALYTYEGEPPVSVDWLRARFRKLETRRSADGTEQWLNWVIRLPNAGLIGYVQATITSDGAAIIGYGLARDYWGRGLAQHAVAAMLAELVTQYQVYMFFAVLKRENLRSLRLLERLTFTPASPTLYAAYEVEPDELLMQLELPPIATSTAYRQRK